MKLTYEARWEYPVTDGREYPVTDGMRESMWMFSSRYGRYDRAWPICVFDELEDGKVFAQNRALRHFGRTEPLHWDEDDTDERALILHEGNRYVEYMLTRITRNPGVTK